MKLVKLKDTKGNTLYINPNHVVFVGTSLADGVPLLSEAAVVLFTGQAVAAVGSPEEVSDLLSGTDKPVF